MLVLRIEMQKDVFIPIGFVAYGINYPTDAQTRLHHLESVRMVDVLILVSHGTTRSRVAGGDGS